MKSLALTPIAYHFREPDRRTPGRRPSSDSLAQPLRYAIGLSAAGHVLLARSPRGICAIFLGDHITDLRAQLAQAFPGLVLHEDAQGLSSDMRRVLGLIEQGGCEAKSMDAAETPAAMDRGPAAIHLDVGGTPFQQKVWRALCAIPAGQTRSYTELAQSLGLPNAARAVASACAANVLAIAIPCHRVLRSDGSISGYRWGPERKRALLARESA